MSASATGQRQTVKQVLQILGCVVAWGWGLVTIIGGLSLITTLGPWPPTNGWFALFSGLAAWSVTAWALKRYGGVNFPGLARFLVALAIILLGRLALKWKAVVLSYPAFIDAFNVRKPELDSK